MPEKRSFESHISADLPIKNKAEDRLNRSGFCNARCLCIWAVSLATKPGLCEDLKNWKSVLRAPTGEEVAFETMIGLAQWAASRALA